MFDERRTQRVPAAAGERGFYRLLEALSGFSTNPAPIPQRLSASMMNAAMEVCHERFPELLDRSANLVPFTWFPILPWSRRGFHQRCRLAGALAEIYQVSIETQMQLIHDDYLMAVYVQNFFNQSGFSWMEPFVYRRGRSANDGLARMEQIAAAVTRAVAYARDNEVFVIFADLLHCSRTISHLLPAIKLAMAKHHRVAFVCPSPTFLRPTKASTIPQGNTTEDLLLAAEQMSLAEESAVLKKSLARIGASLSVSGEDHAIHMILNQMDLARSGRMGVRA